MTISLLFSGFKSWIIEWQNANLNGLFASLRFIDFNLLVIITNFLCLSVLVLTCLGEKLSHSGDCTARKSAEEENEMLGDRLKSATMGASGWVS